MKETPVNKIMENTLEKMREMVDVYTIIGDPMVTGDTTLIPVSKVTYGFTSGGTDLPTKQQNQELFGGGGGGEDDFLFYGGQMTIVDFTDDVDDIVIYRDAIGDADLTRAEVLDSAKIVGDDMLLYLTPGRLIRLEGVIDVTMLIDNLYLA